MSIANCISRILVNPHEVEACLREHPAVMDCGMVGVPESGNEVGVSRSYSCMLTQF